jgi:hypothetical protein
VQCRQLTTAIGADQAVFGSAVPRGESALTGMEAGMIAAALVMAAGCAWGLAPASPNTVKARKVPSWIKSSGGSSYVITGPASSAMAAGSTARP